MHACGELNLAAWVHVAPWLTTNGLIQVNQTRRHQKKHDLCLGTRDTFFGTLWFPPNPPKPTSSSFAFASSHQTPCCFIALALDYEPGHFLLLFVLRIAVWFFLFLESCNLLLSTQSSRYLNTCMYNRETYIIVCKL